MARRFDGSRVFITGASAGIGEAVAVEFARQGARVALAARREERLASVKEQIESAGGEALALCCDVTSQESLEAAVAQAVEAFGGLDVVVANAGFGVTGLLDQITANDWRRQFETNVFGLVHTVYATLPHLKASKGRLALVSSVMGRVGAPTTAPYCASKFAVCGIADSLYYELAEDGVSVTCIEPGLIESDFRMTDNKGQFHEGRSDSAPAWLVMPRATAARHMVRAIHKRKPEAVITLHGKLAVLLSRHFPRTLRALTRAATKGRMDQIARRKRARTE
ncbi:MAG: SDR family oxidoreductase [bacterium]|nr:SDR family oxidoreductase [bacterium]